MSEEFFQSVTYYEHDISVFLRDQKHNAKIIFDTEDPRGFNITVDLGYTVLAEGK